MIHSERSLEEIRVEDYIDVNVTKKVLSRQLGAVNIYELERSDGMKDLVKFARESFKAHYNGRDNNKVKTLDYITINTRIPSRSGSNLVNELNVSSNVN